MKCLRHHGCESIQAKWTKISAKARGQTHVKELDRADKSLADYLALPVEEYSLLDPSWITRCVQLMISLHTICTAVILQYHSCPARVPRLASDRLCCKAAMRLLSVQISA